ncbi:unnamed protein product [Protopolystoma xenopodis]|uniref:Uncharacterized protein n=1 Tax=Protopolystoma xenopodis TaxID=117903 RepID=A0A448XH49_9PLAT|nr:unnamed protein product [Protopolystoma xenopodis]
MKRLEGRSHQKTTAYSSRLIAGWRYRNILVDPVSESIVFDSGEKVLSPCRQSYHRMGEGLVWPEIHVGKREFQAFTSRHEIWLSPSRRSAIDTTRLNYPGLSVLQFWHAQPGRIEPVWIVAFNTSIKHNERIIVVSLCLVCPSFFSFSLQTHTHSSIQVSLRIDGHSECDSMLPMRLAGPDEQLDVTQLPRFASVDERLRLRPEGSGHVRIQRAIQRSEPMGGQQTAGGVGANIGHLLPVLCALRGCRSSQRLTLRLFDVRQAFHAASPLTSAFSSGLNSGLAQGIGRISRQNEEELSGQASHIDFTVVHPLFYASVPVSGLNVEDPYFGRIGQR